MQRFPTFEFLCKIAILAVLAGLFITGNNADEAGVPDVAVNGMPADPKAVTVNNKERANLDCGDDFITVVTGKFTTAKKGSKASCADKDQKLALQKRCNSKNTCTLTPSSRDTSVNNTKCQFTPRMFQITYTCGPFVAAANKSGTRSSLVSDLLD